MSALLAGALSFVTASAAEAATKHPTTVSLQTITDGAAASSQILSGDKVTLSGTASSNLVGKTLHVQLKHGTKWVAYTGTGKVSKQRTFAISTRATGVGKQTYRVSFTATKALKAATGSRSTTVWKWYPLADQQIVSDIEPWGGDEPHSFDQLTVAGTSYSNVLAAVTSNNATGSSDFDLGYHCSTFSTTIGLADNSVTGAQDTFTFYLDGNQAAQQSLSLGKTAVVGLDVSGIFRIRLEQAAVMPKAATVVSAYPAWPGAKVLCSAAP